MADYQETLRRLAIRDDAYVHSVLAPDRDEDEPSCLDPKTRALVRVGALIALDGAAPSYIWSVDAALRHGATVEEIVGTLVAVLPTVGTGRVVSAAPKLGLAVGYDVGEALERLDRAPTTRRQG